MPRFVANKKSELASLALDAHICVSSHFVFGEPKMGSKPANLDSNGIRTQTNTISTPPPPPPPPEFYLNSYIHSFCQNQNWPEFGNFQNFRKITLHQGVRYEN